ncbi:hypothetical protein [Spiroplasma endosymbiont of Lariophagus distinguendus]|uniref:hypothetical protein n=1 Tax=Spiroplasma endosymbiont of Lariophagus distinguendus TaxID=2935082 RepID=UPI00207AA470|nr:hypothetical protein [Spiroplasma endosymbiont of Lariophagus distinguendus]
MKKILSMIGAITLLGTTSIPNVNTSINNNLNQNIVLKKEEQNITNKCKLINLLINFNQPDYFGNKYNGFVYKQEQKIDINDNFISLAKIDNKEISIPNFKFQLNEGEHEIALLLKPELNNFYDLFNADKNGFVYYKFSIKKNMDNNVNSYKLNQSINNIKNFWIDKENNIFIYSNDKLFKVFVGSKIALDIIGYSGILSNNLKFDSENNTYFVANNKIYKINNNSINAVEITINGYSKETKDLFIDSENNIYLIINNNYGYWKNIYKVNHGTTQAIKINIIGLSTSDIFKINFDNKNNLYIISNKLFKVNAGTTNAIEITGYNGLIENISLDTNDNLYFITDKLYKVTIGTNVAKKNNITNLSSGIYDLLVDKENNIFIFSVNGFFKINHDTNNAIEITGLMPKKPINNVCIDNKGNIFLNQDDEFYAIVVGKIQAIKMNFSFNTVQVEKSSILKIIIIVTILLGIGGVGFGSYKKYNVIKIWFKIR